MKATSVVLVAATAVLMSMGVNAKERVASNIAVAPTPVQLRVTVDDAGGKHWEYSQSGIVGQNMDMAWTNTTPYARECELGKVTIDNVETGLKASAVPLWFDRDGALLVKLAISSNKLLSMRQFSEGNCHIELPEIASTMFGVAGKVAQGAPYETKVDDLKVTVELVR